VETVGVVATTKSENHNWKRNWKLPRGKMALDTILERRKKWNIEIYILLSLTVHSKIQKDHLW